MLPDNPPLTLQSLKAKYVVLVLKMILGITILYLLYVYKVREIERNSAEQSKKYLQEIEARQDALEEELRPFIERNKKFTRADGLDVEPEY